MPIDPDARIDPDVRDVVDALEQQLLDAAQDLEARIAVLEASVTAPEVVEISVKKSDESVDTFTKI